MGKKWIDTDVLIIGAGVSGLTVAKNLKRSFKLLEKAPICGGLSTNYQDNGFFFDYGGHYFHFKNREVILDELKDYARFNQYQKNSKVFLLDRFIPFPIQFNLSFFPVRLRTQIYNEIINAEKKTISTSDNLEIYLVRTFGPTLFEQFFKPFLTKYYRRNLSDLVHSMDKGSIPVPSKRDVTEGLRGKKFKNLGYNPEFYYPKQSLRHLIANYSESVRSDIRFNSEAIRIDVRQKTIESGENLYQYRHLVNTMPLKTFLQRADHFDIDADQIERMQHISTVVANVVLERRRRRFHWVYLPDERFPYYRFGYYPGGDQICGYLERTVMEPAPLDSDAEMHQITKILKNIGVIKSEVEVKYISLKYIPVSYILFNRHWRQVVPPVLRRLKEAGIYSIGRYGAWDYSSMSEDIEKAKLTAEALNHEN